MLRSQVGISKCKDYDRVEEAVRSSVELIGGIGSVVLPGQKVVVKPNLLCAAPPEAAITTHPAVVEAVVKLVVEAGGRP
ncbi:MAG TPA: DUF362 domain-containing protein [Candidatus Latescibacteria bacterium]|nr:DUF362 domain-containing protein [Candidatus Latescibacterota bacterium]